MEWIDQGTVKWIKGEFDGLKGEWMNKGLVEWIKG